ncbi:MAG: kynureninase [Burkholderiaceae bacterium]
MTRSDASLSRAHLQQLDADDPLAFGHDRFTLPAGVIYLDGNSLGALPRAVLPAMKQTLEDQWGQGLIRSWNDAGWIDAPQRVGARIASLIGAAPDEVIAADSTSVNLFKALSAALRLRPERAVILGEANDFPTNTYISSSAASLFSREFKTVDADDLLAQIDQQVAVVVLTHVNYRTGRLHDMGAMTQRAHQAGALILWDLCHSAGVMPCELSAHQVDFAVGCGYKYLNGGPGAPAFVYAARRHHADLAHPLTGWLGHKAPFAFEKDYLPAHDLRRMLAGTPPVLGMQALEAALTAFDGVDLLAVRDKSQALTELFITLCQQKLKGQGFTLFSPRDPDRRGSQVSFTHAQAYPIMQALIARGVIGDVRAPDILRFGFAPLYLRYVDVWDAVACLAEIMHSQAYLDPAYQQRKTVT